MSKMTVSELQAKAVELGIQNASKLKKDELIEAITLLEDKD